MGAFSKLIRTAWVVSAIVSLLLPSSGRSQESAPKRILVLFWYDRFFPGNIAFDEQFRTDLRSAAPEGIEYYSEYLETNRFPGENQSLLMRDYLRKKYAGRTIDVVVATANTPLDFLLKHRSVLFPNTPIVFRSDRPLPLPLLSSSEATGIVHANSYRTTLDLALKLHPQTEQLFIISGTLTHDKALESIARETLQGFKSTVAITYLTDLPPEQLRARLRSLPKRSIALYAWQQALDPRGELIETQDFLSRIAQDARVPIYGMSHANVGRGIVGGYVWTFESSSAKLAEITLRVVNGARPAEIPVELAPEVPMFDWRQLQRWGIREDLLPPGSVIRFREVTLWQQYKWRIVGAIVLFVLQAALIIALLVERHRVRRAQNKLREHEEQLEQAVEQRTAELVEARDEALAANRSKSMFLANMSHELRTPLNAILGFSAMVSTNANLSDQDRKDLEIVGSSGEHLLGLIDDVLDMAKIETGGSVVESAAIDLHCLVNDTVDMLRERAQAKNLELVADISSKAPRFVRTDPAKLRQVLTNLVGNALKYTDEGSVVVRLNARLEESSPHPLLVVDVEDTGIGIGPEDQARIFDPFVQAGGARTRKGTGLGLSISRRFVQLLGGSIHVESTLGQGSRFRVEVPVQFAEASEVMAETDSVDPVIGLESGQPDYRILIVEDQRENWLLLQRLLLMVGFQVRVAEDGGQAIEIFRIWRPHFIWMDVRLRVMGGLEAARSIRELDGGREVVIAAVTASAFDSQRQDVLAAGLDDFLRKPYRPREIFDCMARHLGVRYVRRTGPQATVNDVPATLRAENLAALPAALRDELERAVVSLDSKRIAQLVSQVSEQDASLGKTLRLLADRLSYSPILHALQSCKRPLAEAGRA